MNVDIFINILKVIFFDTYNEYPSVGLNVYTDKLHIVGLSDFSVVLLVLVLVVPHLYKRYKARKGGHSV